MVKRHLTIPYRFICFTDSKKLVLEPIHSEILFRELPYHYFPGWWNKLQLFSPEVDLEGMNLYFDLDVVILDSIDLFAAFGDDNTFGIIRDFDGYTPMNSSIMKFNNTVCTSKIWDVVNTPWNFFITLEKNNYLGDQCLITDRMSNEKETQLFPDSWTFSYKWTSRCNPKYEMPSYELVPGCKVAVFHGDPKPEDAKQKWVLDNWG